MAQIMGFWDFGRIWTYEKISIPVWVFWSADVGLAGMLLDKRKRALGLVYPPTVVFCDNFCNNSTSPISVSMLVFEV